jgi:hypothetical protein
MICIRIFLDEPIHSKNGGIITNAIQLIHPVENDIWITKGLKSDGETIHYNVYDKGKQKENFLSLDTLNKTVNGKYYTGRDLVESDFGGQINV